MHMADALISPAVGLVMSAISAGAIAHSTVRIRRDSLSDQKVPLMAVSGAFVFAAQMINFAIPVTGSSGHIGGGMLLAGLLGGPAALLTISAVLIIQCLFFADGGLIALGCNIFNLGVIPCLIVYPLLFKPLVRKGITIKRLALASVLASVIGLQLGSFSVVLETLFSGITELPFTSFLLMMQPIHLAIGLVEGLVTAAVLNFIFKMRPEILVRTADGAGNAHRRSTRKVLAAIAIMALLIGCGLSVFASSLPDGLEWAISRVAGDQFLQSEGGSATGPVMTGLIGGLSTFALAGATGLTIAYIKRRQRRDESVGGRSSQP